MKYVRDIFGLMPEDPEGMRNSKILFSTYESQKINYSIPGINTKGMYIC